MGGFISQLIEKAMSGLGKKDTKMLMIGLDAAGKTTILYNIKMNEVVNTIPTIGFNVESLQYKKLNLTVWDIGGQNLIRKLWRHYYEHSNAVIFVVDSNDTNRLQEVKEELHKVLSDDLLSKCKVLVYANKQDLPKAMNVSEMARVLDMNSIRQDWYIQPCVGTNGNGLFEGLDWLNNKL